MGKPDQNSVAVCRQNIFGVQQTFENVVQQQNLSLNFEKEARFALQVLENNDFLVKTAMQNPKSLQHSIMNVASVGLSLNPAEKHAYLVPRKGVVCLDVSYIGFTQLATEQGGVDWIQAKLVYEKDTFEYTGVSSEPVHQFNPFKDRGKIIGVYCVAKLPTGEFLTEMMSIQDVYDIRDRSEAFKKGYGPWKSDEGEMIKKTVVKRAYKLLPKSRLNRLNKAIEVVNEHEGIDFAKEKQEAYEAQKQKEREEKEKNSAEISEEIKEKEEVLNNIMKLCKELTEGFDKDAKLAFMKDDLQVENFDDLKTKANEDLKDLELYLIEKKGE